MFNKNALEAYQTITAPDSLKERILTAAQKRASFSKRLSVYGSLVAGIVLLCVCGKLWFYPTSDVNVSVYDATTVATPISTVTRISEPYIPIDLSSDGAIAIRTTDTFYLQDEHGVLRPIGHYHRGIRSITLFWNTHDTSAAFTVNGERYTLIDDPKNDMVQITQESLY